MPEKQSQPAISDAAAEFSQLFWAARKEQSQLKGKATGEEPCYKLAVKFAKSQGWEWAERLLRVSGLHWAGEHGKALSLLAECEPSVPSQWLGLVNFLRGATLAAKAEGDEAIKYCRKALDDPRFDRPGYAWNNIGLALFAKGEHDEASNAFRKALDDPKFETPGSAWNNLGTVLRAKGEHDEAIKAFRKALDDPKFDTPGNVWFNLGNAHAAKGEHDEAIKAFRKALADPKYDTPGKAWNNLGNALRAKGERVEAISAFRKALDDEKLDPPAKAWRNLGETYLDMGNREKALEALKKALASPDPEGGDHSRARFHLQILAAKIKRTALSQDDRAIVENAPSDSSIDDVEGGIIKAIQEAGDTQYEKYLAQPDSKREDTLSILRGWSSAVTLLEGSERRWRGGGYFLKWRGYGIVIDPGFDFLRNFHDAGYHGREIRAVLVSHNHPDHNSDLKAIDDLRYELYKRLAPTKESGSQPYVLLWDQDTGTATRFGFEKPQHQHEPVVMASGFPRPHDLRDHPAAIPVRLTPFKVDHGSDVLHAMGMLVELLDEKGNCAIRIGYTGDTAYFPELTKHVADCDLLLAHISQPSIEELQDASKFKEVHLGYRGAVRLLKECKPKLALIAEFWAGFADLRIPLVKALRQRSGVDAILPAGLGMHLNLPRLAIECSECAKPTPFSQIKIAPSADSFGNLAYLCPGCMIG